MIQQIDNNTRIKLKFLFAALDTAICLQRKKWYGWKTVSWAYPSIMKNETCEYIRHWLEWKENHDGEKSQKQIGKEIMSRSTDKF